MPFSYKVLHLCLFVTMLLAFCAVSQSAPDSGTKVAAPSPEQKCVPPCRAGYVCLNGTCVSACNPPCPSGMTCNKQGECVPAEVKDQRSEPARPAVTKRNHTGFFLSMCTGFGNGSMNADPHDTSIKVSGGSIPFSFSIGGAIKENLILFGCIDMNRVAKTTITRNGKKITSIFGKTTLTTGGLGAGVRYYFSTYNAFASISTLVNMATISVYETETSQDALKDFSSDAGLGFDVKIGKEWWVSNRWALGGAFVYNFGFGSSGDLFDVSTNFFDQNFAVLFTATFN